MKKFLATLTILLSFLPVFAHAQTNTTQGGTGLSAYTSGDLIFYSSGLKFNKLPIGSNGKCLIVSSLLPSWQTCPDTDTGVSFNIIGGYASSGGAHDLTLNEIDLTDSSHVTGTWTGSDQGFTYWNGNNLQNMPTDTFFTDGTNIYINHDFWFEKNPSNGAFRFNVAPVPGGVTVTGIINDLFSGSDGAAGFLFSESGIATGNCLEGGATPYLAVDSGAPCGTGGGLSDADYGDITVSGSGTVMDIDAGVVGTTELANDAVTYAKIQNVSASNRLLGRSTAGSGDVEEITVGGDISQSGSTFTIGANAVALTTDTTGNYVSSATASGGLTMTGTEGGSLGVLLPAATNGLSSTTSSGSGLELVSAGLAMLQGCADTEILKWNETTDVWACAADANSGGTTAWNDIGDATADGTIALAGNETDFTSTLDSAGKAIWTITNTDADTAGATDFIDLVHNDGADSDIFYMRATGDADGSPQLDYRFGQTGAFIRPDVTVTGGVATALIEALRSSYAFDFITSENNASAMAGIIRGQRATGTDNDEAYVSYNLSNGAGTSTEMARETWKATDADSGTGIDAQMEWDIKVANSLVNEMILSGTGLDLAASDALSFGGVSIISDSAGTTTLSNVDAIDSTTETTLEAAIDIAGDVTGTGLGSVVVAANAVALTTDTTGNYVADVAGTANEITSTHTPAEGSTATISLPSVIDIGGKTSFELPNGASPTVNVFGQIAGDNDLWAASRGAPVFYDGTAAVGLVGALVSDTPTNGQVPRWNTGGTITWESSSGDFVGPASSTDNAVVRFDSTTGKLGQNSGVIVGDSNDVAFTIADTANVNGLSITQNDATNDKSAISITSARNDTTNSEIYVENTDAGARGASIELYQNSASPAASDALGTINFFGKSSTGVKRNLGYIKSVFTNTTNSLEFSGLAFGTNFNGATTGDVLKVGYEGTSTSLQGISIGRGGNNATLTSEGSFDLILKTGNATTGTCTLQDGANGDFDCALNGSGRVELNDVDIPTISSTDALTNKDISGASNTYRAASTTVVGAAELATSAETTTGTDTVRTITPDGLSHSDFGKRVVSILFHDPISGTALVTGDGKAWFEVPSTLNGYNLVGVQMGVSTVSSSGIPTIQVRRNRRASATTRTDADMLSTKLTVDASEFDSVDAAAAAVIDTSNDDVQTGDHIFIDVDVAGTGTKGANANLIFQLP